MIIKRGPFDPFRGLDIPISGMSGVQGSYLMTPKIIPTAAAAQEANVAKKENKEETPSKGNS